MINTFVCLAREEDDSQHIEGIQVKEHYPAKNLFSIFRFSRLGVFEKSQSFLKRSPL